MRQRLARGPDIRGGLARLAAGQRDAQRDQAAGGVFQRLCLDVGGCRHRLPGMGLPLAGRRRILAARGRHRQRFGGLQAQHGRQLAGGRGLQRRGQAAFQLCCQPFRLLRHAHQRRQGDLLGLQRQRILLPAVKPGLQALQQAFTALLLLRQIAKFGAVVQLVHGNGQTGTRHIGEGAITRQLGHPPGQVHRQATRFLVPFQRLDRLARAINRQRQRDQQGQQDEQGFLHVGDSRLAAPPDSKAR